MLIVYFGGTAKPAQLTDFGHAHVIECADAVLATLIARGSATRFLCQLIGDRYLAVPLDAEPRFRAAARKLGYVTPMA